MNGFGVTNYSTDKPSFAFTTRTTEYDDALLSRNIITLEQAMMAKGVTSADEVDRLTQLVRRERQQQQSNNDDDFGTENLESATTPTCGMEGEELVATKQDYESDDFDDDDDEDEFMAKYRQQRMQELQQEYKNHTTPTTTTYGNVIAIHRNEWMQQVNEDSYKTWVVVLLSSYPSTATTTTTTTSTTDTTTMMHVTDTHRGRQLRHFAAPLPSIQLAVSRLAVRFPHVKFVQIPTAEAISPQQQISSPVMMMGTTTTMVLLYKNGTMKHQLNGVSSSSSSQSNGSMIIESMSESQLEHELSQWGVLEM